MPIEIRLNWNLPNEHTQFAEGNLLSTSYFLVTVKVETDFIKKEWES